MSEMARAEVAMRASLPRLDRIQSLGESLLADIATWNNTHPLTVEFAIDDDGHGWTWTVIGFDPQPDLDGWGVRYGEIAHSFRSLLNHTLTRIARAEGLPRDRQLQFPVATSLQAWKRERKRLRNIPERVVKAIYANQPFVMAKGHGVEPDLDVLAVLAWADNEEKHEMDMIPVMAPSLFTVDNAPEFQRLGASLEDVEVDFEYDFSMTPGSVMTHARYKEEVVLGPGSLDYTMHMAVAVLDSSGAPLEIQAQLNEFMDKVKHVMMTLLVAWGDLEAEIDQLAGSTNFKQGAAFGKAAVNGVHGEGTWEKDFLHSDRFREAVAEQVVEQSVSFGTLKNLVEPDSHSESIPPPPR